MKRCRIEKKQEEIEQIFRTYIQDAFHLMTLMYIEGIYISVRDKNTSHFLFFCKD